MAKFPYFYQLDIGFKHVYDMVGTQQTRAKCFNLLDLPTWSYCIMGTLQPFAAQCNHGQVSIKYRISGLLHVYDMVWTQQTPIKWCQSILHAYRVFRALWAQCNHLRYSATMAKFPYFYQSTLGFQGLSSCMTCFDPTNTCQVLSID